jgi:hypothetical protein
MRFFGQRKFYKSAENSPRSRNPWACHLHLLSVHSPNWPQAVASPRDWTYGRIGTVAARCQSFDKPLIWSFQRSWLINGFRPYGMLDVNSFKSNRWNRGSINEKVRGAAECKLDLKELVLRLLDWHGVAAMQRGEHERTWQRCGKLRPSKHNL